MQISEVRDGDINARAGIVIRCKNRLLAEVPTNMVKNGWLMDLPKGHIQIGETALQAAIRECWEECNVKFLSNKLEQPIQIQYSRAPLYLFLAVIDDEIPVNCLSCVSTFIDKNDGIRKPEVEKFMWINPYTQIYLMNAQLRPGIMHYFNKMKYAESDTSVKFNPAFAKAVYDAFYDSEKETLDFYGKRYKYKDKFDGWPDHLDMENFEICYIGSDCITFQSGGDWQDYATVTLCFKRDSHKLIWKPFDATSEDSQSEIKHKIKCLIDCARSLEEDCQIAGPIMGDLPPNVGSTLSLGYKNGRVLPLPKKKANSKNYDSIPRF
jgi:8-oxo-dGTP pyrophosphatase MutT (NUDIX family)